MKLLVLLNEGARGLAGSDRKEVVAQIERACAEAGVAASVQCLDAPGLLREAKEAAMSDAGAIVIGGGDGIVAEAVNAISSVGHKPIGVLPLGLNNFFARQLNVPLKLDDAIAGLARGKIAELPVAEMSGRIFLAFAAVGLSRERGPMWRRLIGLEKRHVRVRSRGHTLATAATTVIVCNSPYPLKSFGLSPAPPPEPGLLNVYVSQASPSQGFRALLSRLTNGAALNFATMALPEVRIESGRSRLEVSIDGDVWAMPPPLNCRIRPRPLRVLVPASSPLPGVSAHAARVSSGVEGLELDPPSPASSQPQ